MELYNDNNASPTVYKSFAEQLEEGIEKSKQEGIEQGIKQGRDLKSQEMAIKMIYMNLDLELIAEATGLSLEKVHELREENPSSSLPISKRKELES